VSELRTQLLALPLVPKLLMEVNELRARALAVPLLLHQLHNLGNRGRAGRRTLLPGEQLAKVLHADESAIIFGVLHGDVLGVTRLQRMGRSCWEILVTCYFRHVVECEEAWVGPKGVPRRRPEAPLSPAAGGAARNLGNETHT
jgi:hypothetical protein